MTDTKCEESVCVHMKFKLQNYVHCKIITVITNILIINFMYIKALILDQLFRSSVFIQNKTKQSCRNPEKILERETPIKLKFN